MRGPSPVTGATTDWARVWPSSAVQKTRVQHLAVDVGCGCVRRTSGKKGQCEMTQRWSEWLGGIGVESTALPLKIFHFFTSVEAG
jgi:hypothetical protein